jgi:hypothetical protein
MIVVLFCGMTGVPAIVDAAGGSVKATDPYLSDGTTRRLTPTVVAGRKYIGLAVAKQVLVSRIELYDAARHGFAALTSMPTSCGVQPVPPCGTYSPR